MKLRISLIVLPILALASSVVAEPPYPGRTPGNKLTASDVENDARFGNSVAVSGDLAIVGAAEDNGAGSDQGAAYVYDLTTGAQIFKLAASDAANSDHFGSSVAISGNFAIVGASDENGAGVARGAAYVFDLRTGVEMYKLTASDPQNSDLFGSSVALSGNLAVVGAPSEDGAGNDRGAVYVFDLTSGDELFKLTASDAENGDAFGFSVAVSGTFAVVGAWQEDGAGADRGAAYVFDLTTGAEIDKIAPSDGEDGDFFGFSVGVSGTRAIIGASTEDLTGVARIFDLTTGNEIHRLTASDAQDFDQFGQSVAISGDLAVVAANTKDSAKRAIYVFDVLSGNELYKFEAADSESSDFLGGAVALTGNTLLAGASGEDGVGSDRGAAYVFQIDQFQPDNIVGPGAFSGVGSNVHNSSGAGQTQSLVSSKLRPVRGYFTVTSDGDRGEDFLLSATPGNGFFAVQYYRHSGPNRTNVTAALVAGTHRERNVVPEEPGRVFSVDVNPSPKLKKRIRRNGKLRISYLRKTFIARLTSTSTTHDFKSDAAIVRVMTR